MFDIVSFVISQNFRTALAAFSTGMLSGIPAFIVYWSTYFDSLDVIEYIATSDA